MKKLLARKILTGPSGAIVLAALLTLAAAGCGGETDELKPDSTAGATASVQTNAGTLPPAPGSSKQPGIKVDPGLQSATGTPDAEEMKPLIDLQAKVPYPVMVPTYLPGGYVLEKDLIGSSGPSGRDPVGYYSYKYSIPGDSSRTLTFNQSQANAKPLSGYYLTEKSVNGTDFQVYWHKRREYLPDGDPVSTESVGDAETFIVVWKGSFTDAAGQPRDLHYSMGTGTWTGLGWGDIRNILESLTPLESVGG